MLDRRGSSRFAWRVPAATEESLFIVHGRRLFLSLGGGRIGSFSLPAQFDEIESAFLWGTRPWPAAVCMNHGESEGFVWWLSESDWRVIAEPLLQAVAGPGSDMAVLVSIERMVAEGIDLTLGMPRWSHVIDPKEFGAVPTLGRVGGQSVIAGTSGRWVVLDDGGDITARGDAGWTGDVTSIVGDSNGRMFAASVAGADFTYVVEVATGRVSELR